jgi:hypothetical protein
MSFIAEFFQEIIKEVIIDGILQYPGAAIRWLFLRKRKTFKELLNDNFEFNVLVSVLVLVLIISLVYQIIK